MLSGVHAPVPSLFHTNQAQPPSTSVDHNSDCALANYVRFGQVAKAPFYLVEGQFSPRTRLHNTMAQDTAYHPSTALDTASPWKLDPATYIGDSVSRACTECTALYLLLQLRTC